MLAVELLMRPAAARQPCLGIVAFRRLTNCITLACAAWARRAADLRHLAFSWLALLFPQLGFASLLLKE